MCGHNLGLKHIDSHCWVWAVLHRNRVCARVITSCALSRDADYNQEGSYALCFVSFVYSKASGGVPHLLVHCITLGPQALQQNSLVHMKQ